MIISRYLKKEVLQTLLAVTMVLLLVFLSNQLVRYLGYAANGKVAPNVLLPLMGFEIPFLLSLLLPLGLYLGIILAYGRMYADSEMRVLHACGLSMGQLLRMTSGVILFVAVIVTSLSFWTNPWIAGQKDKIITRSMSADNIISNLLPGRFQVSPDGKRVLYVEKISRHKHQAENIFIADQGTTKEGNMTSWSVISAASGSQITDKTTQAPFMVARDGNRYQGVPGNNEFKVIQFKNYAVRLPPPPIVSSRHEQESLSMKTLWQERDNAEFASELQWRISIVLSVLVLGILAIPLSYVAPRRGRYAQMVPAILIYIVYINLLFVARNWVEQSIVPVFIGMWWVHILILFLALGLIYLQINQNRKSIFAGIKLRLGRQS